MVAVSAFSFRISSFLSSIFACPNRAPCLRRVDGRRDVPSYGHEVDATSITESNRICWSSRHKICSER